jgi:hypothetical protein
MPVFHSALSAANIPRLGLSFLSVTHCGSFLSPPSHSHIHRIHPLSGRYPPGEWGSLILKKLGSNSEMTERLTIAGHSLTLSFGDLGQPALPFPGSNTQPMNALNPSWTATQSYPSYYPTLSGTYPSYPGPHPGLSGTTPGRPSNPTAMPLHGPNTPGLSSPGLSNPSQFNHLWHARQCGSQFDRQSQTQQAVDDKFNHIRTVRRQGTFSTQVMHTCLQSQSIFSQRSINRQGNARTTN